uniref:4-hydroxy-4-methyl-2-oxoglutarate aldolase n=1 Tax=Tetraselmis sp. GSL018 TaxID=582737 RepID=A0A061SPP2_9CHLO|mmetsp:Transcript_31529/g.74939  ORF Transcript_31529/g.74939 Transcript_31529/m.74939 type:complete len:117 (-) Transcript_31529:138-488(-)
MFSCRQILGEEGRGRVLVVDGGASERCALLGDQLAELGVKNGWSGVIVNGCIRDSEDIARMPIGVKALATCPLKSSKRDPGLRSVPVSFAGVTVRPGDYIYADKDGILVSAEPLAN